MLVGKYEGIAMLRDTRKVLKNRRVKNKKHGRGSLELPWGQLKAMPWHEHLQLQSDVGGEFGVRSGTNRRSSIHDRTLYHFSHGGQN